MGQNVAWRCTLPPSPPARTADRPAGASCAQRPASRCARGHSGWTAVGARQTALAAKGSRTARSRARAGSGVGRARRCLQPPPGAPQVPLVSRYRERRDGTVPSLCRECVVPAGPAVGLWRGDQERADHRDHRPGRLLSRGAPAREGLRGARNHPPLVDVQHRAPRRDLRGPARREPAAVPPLRRPQRRLRAGEPAARRPAGRGLQPRRSEPRQGELRDARIHGRRVGARGDPAARGGAGVTPRHPCLPGVDLGALRVGAAAAERADAVPSSVPLRRREAVCVLGDSQLPRGVRHVRGQRHPVQPRVPAARRDVRDAQDHARRGADQGGDPGSAVPREHGEHAGLGVRARVRGGHVAHAPGGRARRRRARDRRRGDGRAVRGGVVPRRRSGPSGAHRDRSVVLTGRPR